MASDARNDARLDFRLPSELKQAIEEAATHLGQSVSDFAVSTLVQAARTVIERQSVTRLSRKDRDAFLAILNDTDAKPNRALVEAARRYKKKLG